MHPRYEVEREYAVRLMGQLTDTQSSQLSAGIELEDGIASFDSIQDKGGEGANHWYQVQLREGRNREVRRLFEAVGLMVSRLMRVRFGPLSLPARLKRGQMLELPPKEVAGLLEWAGMPVPRMAQRPQKEKDSLGKSFIPKERKPQTRERGTPAASYSAIRARALATVASLSNDSRASTSVDTRPGTIARISRPKRTSSRSASASTGSPRCAATVSSTSARYSGRATALTISEGLVVASRGAKRRIARKSPVSATTVVTRLSASRALIRP